MLNYAHNVVIAKCEVREVYESACGITKIKNRE